MDPELKILLEQLISAISTPSEFDNVTLSVSITSALLSFCVSALLGYITYKLSKRQNEIAEQQTEIQKRQYQIEKFNNYKDLHRDIYKCKCILESILPRIYEYFIASDRTIQRNAIDEYEKKLTELLFDIQNGVSDVMLRGDKQLNIDAVQELLAGASFTLVYAMQHPPLHANTNDFFATLHRGAELRELHTIDEQMQFINELSQDPGLKAGMELFVKQYKEVFEGENNILAQLQRLYNE